MVELSAVRHMPNLPPMSASTAHLCTWVIALAATAGVIGRPFRVPEAVWAVAGATLLVAVRLLPVDAALAAVGTGSDVYFFLIGMMLLSETGRRTGLFDWVAGLAVHHARGSRARLFTLVYTVGTLITVFLSNDACAVVLTPAVYAAARRAGGKTLPYLFVCAFIANAASFVLPISNPANLVLYGGVTPRLGAWLASFALPSLLSIAATYVLLRYTVASDLAGDFTPTDDTPRLSITGRVTLAGIIATAAALTTISALDRPLGLPTLVLGALTAAVALLRDRGGYRAVVGGVAWSVLFLVAGLFVLVAALDRTGLIDTLARSLASGAHASIAATAAVSGILLALGSNLTNNLPAGLIASSTIAHAHPPLAITDALLIGVDLGPNLSITGSLATILWLTALRRDGIHVGFWEFLRVGARVMLPALALALGARLLLG